MPFRRRRWRPLLVSTFYYAAIDAKVQEMLWLSFVLLAASSSRWEVRERLNENHVVCFYFFLVIQFLASIKIWEVRKRGWYFRNFCEKGIIYYIEYILYIEDTTKHWKYIFKVNLYAICTIQNPQTKSISLRNSDTKMGFT